ncbi:MAG: hypothetical protein JWM78_1500 [Verrucomicrobiaceae bacterium]|nr:hypothetical protein [Verrucomicrobiaceae bacterium]
MNTTANNGGSNRHAVDAALTALHANPSFWRERLDVASVRLLDIATSLLPSDEAQLWQLHALRAQFSQCGRAGNNNELVARPEFISVPRAYIAALEQMEPFSAQPIDNPFSAIDSRLPTAAATLHLPIAVRGEVWGVLLLSRAPGNAWSQADIYRANAINAVLMHLLLEHRVDHADHRFQMLAQNAPIAILEFDEHHNVLYRNEQLVDLIGADHQRWTADTWASIIAPSDGRDIQLDVKTAERDGRLQSNYRITRPDGSVRHVLWHVSKVQTTPESSIAKGRLGVALDITSLWETQQQLQELTAQQRNILDHAAHAIIATDMEGKIVSFNPAAERLLGYSAAEMLGNTPDIFNDQEDLRRFRQENHHADFHASYHAMIKKILEHGVQEFEWNFFRKDGTRVPVRASNSVLKNAAGEPLGLLALAVDQTDRKRILEMEQREQNLIMHVSRGTNAAVGEQFFDHLVAELRKATGADYVHILMHLPELEGTKGIMLNRSITPEYRDVPIDFANSPVEHTIKSGQIVHLTDAQTSYPNFALLKEIDLHECIAVPLVSSAGVILGAVTIGHRGALPESALAKYLLEIFAVRASSELERLRNERAQRAREEEQHWLYEASAQIHAQRTVDDVARTAVLVGSRHRSNPRVTVALSEGDKYRLLAYHGAPENAPFSEVYLRQELFYGAILKAKNNILLVPDFTEAMRGTDIYEEAAARNIRAVVCMALVENGDDIGTMTFDYPDTTAFDKLDLDMLGMFGRSVALAMSRALHRQSLEYQAEHDGLTGLFNRSVLHRDFIKWQSEGGNNTALLLLDLDRFKEVNDTLGHHVGDALLRQIGERLRAGMDYSDATIARLGGDEFAVLLRDTNVSKDRAHTLAVKILEALRQPFQVNGINLEIGASIGVALYPDHGDDSHALLRSADVAMYEAKRTGSGVALYHSDLDFNTPERLAIITDFHNGIRQRELILFYQPKIELVSKRITGFEALLRWQHPRLGLLAPDRFLPLVEMTDAIHALTHAVVEMACQQLQQWLSAGEPWTVAVNLSARNLMDDRIVHDVSALMQRYEIPAGRLEFEITETALIQDPAHALVLLERIAALGIALSIDDFGIGYSSLAYLRDMPISTLKIDRTFVRDMQNKPQDQLIIRSIIQLAHGLNLKVIAEGVEYSEVMAWLTGMGCDQAQGYFISRPLPACELPRWIQQWAENIKPIPLEQLDIVRATKQIR